MNDSKTAFLNPFDWLDQGSTRSPSWVLFPVGLPEQITSSIRETTDYCSLATRSRGGTATAGTIERTSALGQSDNYFPTGASDGLKKGNNLEAKIHEVECTVI